MRSSVFCSVIDLSPDTLSEDRIGQRDALLSCWWARQDSNLGPTDYEFKKKQISVTL